jgi:hypothetical protein
VAIDAIDVDLGTPAPWGSGERATPRRSEIVIRGLDARGQRIVRRTAERLGGTVEVAA